MQPKYAIFLLSFALVIAACKKKEIDPCNEPTATDCNGLVTNDILRYDVTTSPQKLYSLSVNPQDPNDLVIVGMPEGYEDLGIYRMNLLSKQLTMLQPVAPGSPIFPDWGANGLILFPFRNNAIFPDGTPHGPIKGCPAGLDLYLHWTQNATKIAASIQQEGKPSQFLLIDYAHEAIMEFGPIASGAYGTGFSITEDGSKVCPLDYGGSLQWTDLRTGETHDIDNEDYAVHSADWLADNKTIVWVGNKSEYNACGRLLTAPKIFATDVTTASTTVVAEGCFWNYIYSATASPDGNWLYVLQTVTVPVSDSELLSRPELWRMHPDGSHAEFILR